MIAENNIEFAAIVTESGPHAEIALYCIDQGINVIIEKPIAMSMADAEEGFQDDDVFTEYYQMKGDIPDKIIYINSEGRALSIDDDQNEWADFIYENYMQTFEHGEGLFYMRAFEIINDNN